MSDLLDDDTMADAAPPTCPPWCVDCWDISDDLPGSRFHHGQPTPPIPALVDISGSLDQVSVQISFCDVSPQLHRAHLNDDTARVDICLSNGDAIVSLLPADARHLAQTILRHAKIIESSPSTRPPS